MKNVVNIFYNIIDMIQKYRSNNEETAQLKFEKSTYIYVKHTDEQHKQTAIF